MVEWEESFRNILRARWGCEIVFACAKAMGRTTSGTAGHQAESWWIQSAFGVSCQTTGTHEPPPRWIDREGAVYMIWLHFSKTKIAVNSAVDNSKARGLISGSLERILGLFNRPKRQKCHKTRTFDRRGERSLMLGTDTSFAMFVDPHMSIEIIL